MNQEGIGTLPQEVSIFPASFAQTRIWLIDRLEPDSPVYNITMAARLEGRLEARALHSALNAVVARHEPLRTTFAVEAGQPVQVIPASAQLEMPVIDLSSLEPAAREAEARRLLKEDGLKPFNLERDLMLRVQLLRLGPEEHLLDRKSTRLNSSH